MSRQLNKTTTIKGCAIWAMQNGVVINPLNPNADNVSITLPELSFGTTDLNLMGTISVPDFTRIDNFTVSASIGIDNPDSKPLRRLGIQEWKITYCVGVVNVVTGLETLTPVTIYAKGYVSGLPLGSAEQGSDNMGDVSMNCVSLRKISGTALEFEIDRLAGVLRIGDVSYSSLVNTLY